MISLLPDFEMIQHKFYGGYDITVIPIFDVHLGAEECMEEEFEQFIQTVKDHDHVYVVLGGDLVDNGLKNSLTNVYRQKYMPSEQKRRMAKLLEPIRDRILCSVSGNHESRSARECDDSVTYDIMSKLDLEHLCRENMAFVKIKLGKEHTRNGAVTDGTRRPTYVLVVTHGAGGGMLTGSAVNRSDRFGYVIDGMDALIVGHSHKPFTTQPGKIYIDRQNNQISVKPFKVISATSWLRYGGYAAGKLLLPSSHDLQTLTLGGFRKEILVTM